MLNLEIFGQRVRALRMEKNMTQQQLADAMFVSRKTISNWETGSSVPDNTLLPRLASHLGVETHELLDAMYSGEGEPNILVVEREARVLKSFVQLITDTLPEAQVYGFDAMSEVLRFFSGNQVAAAFINVELLGDDAINLAQMMNALSPKTNIIFLARNYDFADKAMQARASGYVLLPLSREKILEEIRHLRNPVRGLTTLTPAMQ